MILNYIWVAFFLIAFAVGLCKLIFLGDTEVFPMMVKTVFDMSKTAVMDIAFGLIGIITLWMGLMKVGEKAGVVDKLAKVVAPFFKRLFPGIPEGSPVGGHIMMNFSANMLGLDNAATPIGLKAMQGMQELNPDKETASNAQIMFLVLNTSGLTIIPVTIMAYRAQAGAADPSDIFIPTLIATFCSTIVGLLVVAAYQKINLLDKVIVGWLGAIIALIGGIIWYFSTLSNEQVQIISSVFSNVLLLSIIILFILLAFLKKINVFESFIEGAKEGFDICIKLIPYLVGILVAIALFRACGALDFILLGMKKLVVIMGMDTRFVDAMPTAFMKPLSGGASRTMMIETMKAHGADSFAGRLSCMFQGAADTTLYIIAVYFGSVGIRKTRYSVTAGLLADLGGVIAAIAVAYIFFG